MRVVAVSDGMIRLGQFLKLVNMVNAGSEAKRAIAAGSVRVNDVELRRGRQLHSGDVVAVGTLNRRPHTLRTGPWTQVPKFQPLPPS